MRIDIITLHCPMNCGSVLQGYALRKFLGDRYGDENVALIDYVPPYMETEGRPFRTLLRKMLFFKQYRMRQRAFSTFIESNCRLTEKRYKTYDELLKDPPEADIYITGSDQLWNPCFSCGNDPAYFLRFVQNVPKLAYSTSLGTAKYSRQQLTQIADNIKDYSVVSVRERCSVSQLESVGVHGVQCVCDPTLLHDAGAYSRLAKDHKELGKYVAVYLVEPSDLLDQTLDVFRKMGYKVVGVAGYLNKYKCDIRLMDAGPAEFLGLIRDASFVVATSFHATVFSLIFHKQFAIIPPHMNPERIEQLLGMVHLENRILTGKQQIPSLLEEIDFKEVDQILQPFIQESSRFLTEAIDSLEREENK